MKFLDFEIANHSIPLYVAEISCNHKGQLNELLKIIEIAKWSGADVVKIQCYEPDDLTWDNGYVIQNGTWKGRNLYDLYRHTQTPYEWIKPIFEFAKQHNIPLFSSVYSQKGLDILEEAGCPAYKIASFEAHNPYFVKKVSLTGKSVIMSTGMMGLAEIKESVKAISEDHKNNLCLLHCVSSYPTKTQDATLNKIVDLKVNFPNIPIGYSDHTASLYSAIAAVAMGVCLIEKHFSGMYNNIESEDGTFSLGSYHFRKMVKICNQIHGGLKWDVTCNEETEIRSSLHIVKDIKAGEEITENHIQSLRPYLGLHPSKLQYVIGKKSKVDILPGTPLLMEYLENE